MNKSMDKEQSAGEEGLARFSWCKVGEVVPVFGAYIST